MGSFSIWHWIIVLVVVVLIFGTKKLKGVGKDLGEGIQGFKEGLGIAFHTRTAGGESLGHGEGEKAACDCAADRFHGGFPQSMNCFVIKKFAR